MHRQVFWLGSSLPPSRFFAVVCRQRNFHVGSLTATGIAPEFLAVTGFPLHRDVLPGFVAGGGRQTDAANVDVMVCRRFHFIHALWATIF